MIAKTVVRRNHTRGRNHLRSPRLNRRPTQHTKRSESTAVAAEFNLLELVKMMEKPGGSETYNIGGARVTCHALESEKGLGRYFIYDFAPESESGVDAVALHGNPGGPQDWANTSIHLARDHGIRSGVMVAPLHGFAKAGPNWSRNIRFGKAPLFSEARAAYAGSILTKREIAEMGHSTGSVAQMEAALLRALDGSEDSITTTANVMVSPFIPHAGAKNKDVADYFNALIALVYLPFAKGLTKHAISILGPIGLRMVYADLLDNAKEALRDPVVADWDTANRYIFTQGKKRRTFHRTFADLAGSCAAEEIGFHPMFGSREKYTRARLAEWQEAGGYGVRTLHLMGALDKAVPAVYQRLTFRRFLEYVLREGDARTESKQIEIEGGDHMILVRKAEESAKAIAAFLKNEAETEETATPAEEAPAAAPPAEDTTDRGESS